MKKLPVFFAAMLAACLIVACTKESGDIGTTEESDGGTGLYGGRGIAGGDLPGSGGSTSGSGDGDSTQQIPADPGQITAAEWNDLAEWDFWINLGQHEEFNKATENWRFYPVNRYSFKVENSQFNPLADCEIELKDRQGQTIWKARTNNEGKADCWIGLNNGNTDQVAAIVTFQSQSVTIVDPVAYDHGINTVTLALPDQENSKVDILFVVDATGSMTDEINYLKSELLDVIERVEDLNSQLDLKVGSVFYRDEGDEYLTRVSPFSANLGQTLTFIRNQTADGGGDYEEAVHTALNTAITQLTWSDQARARLLFLLLDAPPHHTESIVNELHDIIRTTAEKGIRIIPISASGINKDTEFLFRFFAVATGGTYVFITNDSGIGGDHIEATVGEYEVELLNDLIVRLIDAYTE
jgi:hypothetical protein